MSWSLRGADTPFLYLERPDDVAPINKGHKVYALLRETLVKAGKTETVIPPEEEAPAGYRS